MVSNTPDLMNIGTPASIVRLFRVATNDELTPDQAQNAETLVARLGAEATVSDFAEAAAKTPGLEQFGATVATLFSKDYSWVFELEPQ
jgi:hypothetical protein